MSALRRGGSLKTPLASSTSGRDDAKTTACLEPPHLTPGCPRLLSSMAPGGRNCTGFASPLGKVNTMSRKAFSSPTHPLTSSVEPATHLRQDLTSIRRAWSMRGGARAAIYKPGTTTGDQIGPSVLRQRRRIDKGVGLKVPASCDGYSSSLEWVGVY